MNTEQTSKNIFMYNDLNVTSNPTAAKAEFELLSFECHKYSFTKTRVNKTFSL